MHYEIRVSGVLDSAWSAWFDSRQITSDDRETVTVGPVADQAALHGLLAKFRDLGLELTLVRRTDPDEQPRMEGPDAASSHPTP